MISNMCEYLIHVTKDDKIIGNIQSIKLNSVRELTCLMQNVKDTLTAECNKFRISLQAINEQDRCALLEDCGIDFTFGVLLSRTDSLLTNEWSCNFVEPSTILWKEKGFRFDEFIDEYVLQEEDLYMLEKVKIVKDKWRIGNENTSKL